MSELDAFQAAEARTPPYPGACCRMADRWFTICMGFSALDRYGRDFASDAEVEAWLSEPGGIAVAVNRVMRAAGTPRTPTPRLGDVRLALHAGRLCMSIFDGRRWYSRDERGMIGMPEGLAGRRGAWVSPEGASHPTAKGHTLPGR